MSRRYGTFTESPSFTRMGVGSTTFGVIDKDTGSEYHTANLSTATRLAELLNKGTDCRFNCRAKREADYLQGWVDRDRDCPITDAGKRCAARYVAGAKSGLKNPLTSPDASKAPDREDVFSAGWLAAQKWQEAVDAHGDRWADEHAGFTGQFAEYDVNNEPRFWRRG